MHKLRGLYSLVAGIYTPKATTPAAQIYYPKAITAASYKEHLRFAITRDSLDNAVIQTAGMRTSNQVFSATLFEGAGGNHRLAKPIPNGVVRVIGFPEWGTFTSDSDGNVRIPKVPGRSELLIEANAPGYYPTYRTVPTFSTNVYVPIYLISRDKVDVITRYFTRSPQLAGRAIIMGRVFDPSSRAPKKDEMVGLTARKKGALYIGALPDPSLLATADTGLFAFFNVVPTFRSLLRPEKFPFLLNARPNSAEYIEFGRGGKKNFSARLIDPFNSAIPAAKIRVVGNPKLQVLTDKAGSFKIPDLDLPPGTVTLEVESENYPLTWYTLPWNTRERESTRSLFIMEKELIQESAASGAKLNLDRDKGSIIGGADAAFFQKGQGCVSVVLQSGDGKPVDPKAGPFPLAATGADPTRRLCLTPRSPGFAYFNLPSGEYILKWVGAGGEALRSHLVYVGVDRVSVAVD